MGKFVEFVVDSEPEIGAICIVEVRSVRTDPRISDANLKKVALRRAELRGPWRLEFTYRWPSDVKGRLCSYCVVWLQWCCWGSPLDRFSAGTGRWLPQARLELLRSRFSASE